MAIVLRTANPGSACCNLCGCANPRLDYWDDPDAEASLQLAECPRCGHRWTRSLVQPVQRAVSSAAASGALSSSSSGDRGGSLPAAA
jgi:uncharacterized paraquat-inducible protein A